MLARPARPQAVLTTAAPPVPPPTGVPAPPRDSAPPAAARPRESPGGGGPGRRPLDDALARLSPYGWRLLGITAAALLARTVLLGHQPLWRDEAFTELASQRGWLAMLDVVRHDSAPPLSYVLTHLVTSLSTSSWALRLPAALAGTAAVPLAAALGRRVGGDRTGVCAAGLVALSPLTVTFSRDARMYALAGSLVLAACLAMWRAVERPDRRRLALLGAVAAAALLTQYLTALAIAAIALAGLVTLRPGRAAVLRVGVTLAAATLPVLAWLPAALPQLQHAADPFWVQSVTGAALLGVLTEFFCGPSIDLGVPHREAIQWLQAGAIALGGVGGLVLILHTLMRAWHTAGRAVAYLALCGFGGLSVVLLISLEKPILDARYAYVLEPPLLVLVGVGIGRIRPRRLASIPLGAMGVAAACLVWFATRPDVPPTVAALGPAPAAGEVVLAHREVYLQAVVAEAPAWRAVTHVDGGLPEWFWGVAVYPDGAALVGLPPGTTRIDELADGVAPPAAQIPADFRAVSRRCATDACLIVWER